MWHESCLFVLVPIDSHTRSCLFTPIDGTGSGNCGSEHINDRPLRQSTYLDIEQSVCPKRHGDRSKSEVGTVVVIS